MMGYFECFQFYIAFPTPKSVSGINGSLLAYGIGTVVLLDENDNIHELQKVTFVPGLDNLIIPSLLRHLWTNYTYLHWQFSLLHYIHRRLHPLLLLDLLNTR
jgi:hypothetical protein